VECLSSEPLVGDESLNLGGLIESSLGTTFFLGWLLDFPSDNALPWVILLSECEGLPELVGSLWSKSSWSVGISESGNLTWALLEDLEEEGGEVWAADASSD